MAKIALMGSAPSSVRLGPFKDSRYEQWLQGKIESVAKAHGHVPGDWDIWGCSPGCWAVIPRATRWFEVHRWEPGQPWFSHEYCAFLMSFNGPVYTGSPIPEIKNHVVYPIHRMVDKFSPYFFTSSLALMLALAIDTIEQVRQARAGQASLPSGIDASELAKTDDDDMIGMWGVDMAAAEEWGYQRPGCQFFILEALRRGIGFYLPPESDLLRPMPIYGISEWDHNYIKMTARARELNTHLTNYQTQLQEAQQQVIRLQAAQAELGGHVNTWTSPYGLPAGIVLRHQPGTGLGGDVRKVMQAMAGGPA